MSYRGSVSEPAGLEKSTPFAAGGCQGGEGSGSCGRRDGCGGERKTSDASAGPSDSRGRAGSGRLFLLLRAGADRDALGKQLSGAVSGN